MSSEKLGVIVGLETGGEWGMAGGSKTRPLSAGRGWRPGKPRRSASDQGCRF